MSNFLQNFDFNILLKYGSILLGIILAIIIAKFIASIIKNTIKKANYLKKLFEKIGVSINLETLAEVLSKISYFIIIFTIIVGLLKYLHIEIKLINNILDDFLPKIINASGLAVIAWFLATVTKTAIIQGTKNIKLSDKVGTDDNISESIGTIAYWSIVIFFLPQILEKLGQNKLLEPINNIINSITNYIPNIIGASIIFIIGSFVAKILKQITISVLNSLQVNKASKKLGLKDFSIPNLAGTLVYILIIVPIAIQALDKLQIEVISKPATKMLEQLMNMIPLVLTAGIIITISFFFGKFIKNLTTELLTGAGFDKILSLIGLKNIESKTKPSEVVGTIVFSYILLLAAIEASNTIGFGNIAEIINKMIIFSTNIIIGIIIFGIGLFLSKTATKAIKSTSNSKILPILAKTSIIILTSFMGLQQMGIGGDIINQAFTLLLGSIAVAFALAVGLGAKKVAGEEIKNFLENIKK